MQPLFVGKYFMVCASTETSKCPSRAVSRLLHDTGLDWRISLVQECLFYWRTCQNWKQVIGCRMNDTIVDAIRLRNHKVLCFSGRPPFAMFQEVWRHEVYTPNRRLKPTTIVDVGANIGVFCLYAATRWPGASIHAYEPAPENATLLERNIRLNGLSCVIQHREGVAKEDGTRLLYLSKDSDSHSFWRSSAERSIAVPVVGLGTVIKSAGTRVIDVLKVDCEGAEYEFLCDQVELLSRHVRFLAMECHPVAAWSAPDMLRALDRAGFECRHKLESWGGTLVHAWNRDLEKLGVVSG